MGIDVRYQIHTAIGQKLAEGHVPAVSDSLVTDTASTYRVDITKAAKTRWTTDANTRLTSDAVGSSVDAVPYADNAIVTALSDANVESSLQVQWTSSVASAATPLALGIDPPTMLLGRTSPNSIGTFRVSLNRVPDDPVTVTMTADSEYVTLTPSSFTLSGGNPPSQDVKVYMGWRSPSTVTVTATGFGAETATVTIGCPHEYMWIGPKEPLFTEVLYSVTARRSHQYASSPPTVTSTVSPGITVLSSATTLADWADSRYSLRFNAAGPQSITYTVTSDEGVTTATWSANALDLPTYIASFPNLALWLDASSTATITKDGSNKVSQWSDRSGNNRHVVQAVADSQPTFIPAASNFPLKVNAISFDGVDDFLDYAGGTGSLECTILFAAKLSTLASQQQQMMGIGTRATNTINSSFDIGTGSANGYFGFWSYNLFRSSLVARDTSVRTHSFQIQRTGGNTLVRCDYWINSSWQVVNQTQAIGAPQYNAGVVRLGKQIATTDLKTNCQIYEVLIYNSVLTDVQRQAVEAYLMTKWSII